MSCNLPDFRWLDPRVISVWSQSPDIWLQGTEIWQSHSYSVTELLQLLSLLYVTSELKNINTILIQRNSFLVYTRKRCVLTLRCTRYHLPNAPSDNLLLTCNRRCWVRISADTPRALIHVLRGFPLSIQRNTSSREKNASFHIASNPLFINNPTILLYKIWDIHNIFK